MNVLLTGFEPFGGDRLNPSGLVIHRLREVLTLQELDVLSVSIRRTGSSLIDLLRSIRPGIYIGLGLWSGIPYVTIGRITINVMDARILDNDGGQPIDEPIELEGLPAYFTTPPKKAILRKLKESGIPAIISNTARTSLQLCTAHCATLLG